MGISANGPSEASYSENSNRARNPRHFFYGWTKTKAADPPAAFQGEHAENAFVDATERLSPHESLQAFDSQRKFFQGQRTLLTESPTAQTRQVLLDRVVRAINDAQIFAPGISLPAARVRVYLC